ncbi:aldo/keto reductase [Aquabacterium sp.]|uniref:aldo/keto reductase n=1 Tax=Aquabacterium sp. TaxID=1872578 RepID=UPI002C605E6D|nr:aldo/keto reductase [Aquabacterium sp.]HSW07942.1 aldo/keto reductase [Aquabacterium sp.]
MQQTELPDGTPMPALGLGTWRMGESAAARKAEVAAVRLAIELGYRLIDTAEMYGEGGAETVVGQAIAEAIRAGTVRREELVVVSKVYPHNASREGAVAACERSLQRLGLDQIDLYLLHWRGQHALRETVAGMHALQAGGRIRHWGVSNLDVADMNELIAASPGLAPGAGCATDQVYYSLGERGAEFSLLPWLRKRSMPLMAYSPIDQGQRATDRTLAEIGQSRGLSAAQVALAWVLAQDGVIAIPKAVSALHLRENLAAADIVLSADEIRRIDARYPPPKRKTALAMI